MGKSKHSLLICLSCYGIECIERLHALQVSDVALCSSLARCYAQAAGTTSKEEFDKPFAEDLLVAFLEDVGGVADVHVLTITRPGARSMTGHVPVMTLLISERSAKKLATTAP